MAATYDRAVPTAVQTTLALKEWDVVVAALEQGHQAILVRKGGLLDPEQRIPLPQRPFWLYPTLFHERTVFLKPEHHELLVPGAHRRPRSASPAAEVSPTGHPRPAATGRLALRALAEVAATVEAPSLASLQALEQRTVWTDKYLKLRYRWREQDRPLVLVLAVSVLPAAVEIDDLPEYAGCRSWVELRDAPDAGAAEPVWSPARLAEEVAAVRAARTGTE